VSRSRYAFRNFELDAAGRELRYDGTAVELAASAFDCLVYLIANRDRAIGRDELISATWGCTGTSDTTLAHTLVRLRRLLGDAGSEQHTIRTIPRVGYRWIAPVREYAAGSEVRTEPACERADAATGPTADACIAASPRRTPMRRLIAAAVAAAMAAAALCLPLSRHAAPARVATTGSIVLPATTATLSDEWKWIRFSLSELIAARLSRGEFPALPSARIATPPDEPARRVSDDALEIQPDVTHSEAVWQVRLLARDAQGRAFAGEGRGSDPMQAAQRAADAFLDTMGYAAPGAGSETADAFRTDRADGDRLQAILDAAQAAAAQERYDEAVEHLGDARALGERDGDAAARIDVAFGVVLLRRQQPAMALPYLHRALAGLGTGHDAPVRIDALTAVAEAQLALRANDAALVAAVQAGALASAREEASPATEVYVRALAASGKRAEAARVLERLQPRTALEQARVQALRARLALDADAPADAAAAATLALTAELARADRAGYAHAWIDRIRALQRTDRLHEARIESQRLARWCDSGCASTQAERLALDAEQAAAEQRFDDALRRYANALRVADRTATPATQATVVAAYLETLVAARRMDVAVAVAGRLTERDLAAAPPRTRDAAAAVRNWQAQVLRDTALVRANATQRDHGIVR